MIRLDPIQSCFHRMPINRTREILGRNYLDMLVNTCFIYVWTFVIRIMLEHLLVMPSQNWSMKYVRKLLQSKWKENMGSTALKPLTKFMLNALAFFQYSLMMLINSLSPSVQVISLAYVYLYKTK